MKIDKEVKKKRSDLLRLAKSVLPKIRAKRLEEKLSKSLSRKSKIRDKTFEEP